MPVPVSLPLSLSVFNGIATCISFNIKFELFVKYVTFQHVAANNNEARLEDTSHIWLIRLPGRQAGRQAGR